MNDVMVFSFLFSIVAMVAMTIAQFADVEVQGVPAIFGTKGRMLFLPGGLSLAIHWFLFLISRGAMCDTPALMTRLTTSKGPVTTILVFGHLMSRLDKATQEFIIQHEIAHATDYEMTLRESIMSEFYADEVAAERLNLSKEVAAELIKNLRTHFGKKAAVYDQLTARYYRMLGKI